MTVKVDEIVAAYIKLRDMKDATSRRHKEELAPINEKMGKLEAWLQKHLQSEGVDSMKTKAGTAFLQSNSSATVKDWPATLEWVKDNDEWSFLEARVNKTAVKDYMESTGDIPPGVDFKTTIVTRVRR